MSEPTSSPEPEASGRNAGRLKSRQGYASSYAAIGMLKDNLQSVGIKKGSDSKGGSERGTPDEPRSPRAEVSLQRIAPSRENALLRAEVELLKQQNQELTNRVSAAESRLGQHSRQLRHSHSGLQVELTSLKEALTSADAEKATALSVAETAFTQMESIGKTLEDLLLQPIEVEAAAIACCWLAHYWELAHAYDLYPEVSAANAAYWRAVAPPPSAVVESARFQQQQQQQPPSPAAKGGAVRAGNPAVTASVGPLTASNTASSNSSTPLPGEAAADMSGPEWLKTGSGRFSFSMQATAADMLEVERGLTQLQQLGVQTAVMAAMASQAHSKRATLQLSTADLDGCCTGQPVMAALSPQEMEEVRFQAAYLAYLWGRAAQLGVEQHVAAERSDHWHSHLDQPPRLRDLQDLQLGFQEVALLGLEQKIWQARYSTSSSSSWA